MRILHLREPEVGGVRTIIDQYAQNTPAHQHVVVHTTMRRTAVVSAHAADGSRSELAKFVGVASSAPPQVAIRKLTRMIEPDVVHAHSSWAGLFVRTTPGLDVPIVYTPHCFSFERLDVSTIQRRAFRFVESRLLSRTVVLAAASRREAAIGRSLRQPGRYEVVEVPHAAAQVDANAQAPRPSSSDGRPLVIGCVGRLAVQKRPDMFVDLAAAVDARGLDCRFVWIGGGEDAVTALLRDAGILVTGWLDQDEAMDQLRALDALVHVADWEVGDPLVCIEAAVFGLPVGYRDTPSSEFNVVGQSFVDVAAGAGWVEALHDDQTYRDASAASLAAAARFDPAIQRERLMHAYSIALG